MKKLLLLSTLAVATIASAQTKRLYIGTSVVGSMETFELYQKQTDGSFSLLKSKEEDSGHWIFDSLNAGTYRVHVGIASNKYLPTWYYSSDSSVLFWDGAANIDLTTADSTGIIIQMIANPAALNGPGSIGGTLTEGLMKSAGDPLKDVRVILKDSNNNLVTLTKSDTSGNFRVNNLPLGKYKVVIDLVNASTANPKAVTLDSTNMSDTTMTLTVNKTGTVNTSIATVAGTKETVTLYPNPATDLLYVNTTAKSVIVSVYSITGKLLLNEVTTNNNSISLQPLSQGLYIVRVQAGEQTFTQRLIKQ